MSGDVSAPDFGLDRMPRSVVQQAQLFARIRAHGFARGDAHLAQIEAEKLDQHQTPGAPQQRRVRLSPFQQSPERPMSRKLQSLLLVAFLLAVSACSGYAKARPKYVVVWPSSGTPVVQFTFWKLDELETLQGERVYTADVEAQNVWNKQIPEATFLLYLFDKDKARIGDGTMTINNAAPGEVVKFQMNITATGKPDSVAVVPTSLPGELGSLLPRKTISVTVHSVPEGAHFALDGVDEGTTPKAIPVTTGSHMLEFTKEGFTPGKFPFAIGPDDLSGTNVSFDLGTAAHDTIELRDGTVVTGDLLSVSATQLTVRVGGTVEQFDRNRVKKILLVQRVAADGSGN